jgi:hypothetical protein
VSRLSRERTQIALSPHHVAMVWLTSGWNGTLVTDRRMSSCAASEAQPNWSAALDTLSDMLRQPVPAAVPATVILSNHFVRYMTLPWNAELVTRTEESEFARARFVQVFGDKARHWAVRSSDAPARFERLAAATDMALLKALGSTLSAAGLTLASCQPALMAQFNASLDRVGDDAWLVSVERGRLLIAWIARGHWRSVRVRPLGTDAVALRELLEQESMLVSGPAIHQNVLVSATDDVVLDTQGLTIGQLGARGNGPETADDAPYALAMAGVR